MSHVLGSRGFEEDVKELLLEAFQEERVVMSPELDAAIVDGAIHQFSIEPSRSLNLRICLLRQQNEVAVPVRKRNLETGLALFLVAQTEEVVEVRILSLRAMFIAATTVSLPIRLTSP